MEKPDGIYTDISIQDYHKKYIQNISATSIKEAKVSSKQFHWHRTGKMPESDGLHFSLGNAFELALLDRPGFDKSVAIEQQEYWIALAQEERKAEGKEPLKTPRNSTRYKAEVSKFDAANEGKYVIPDKGAQSYEAIEEMLKSCYSDETIKKLIEGTEYQLSLFWTDEQTGLKLKTRPDICKRKKNVIVNLKTIQDGSPKAFSRELAKFDYPLQACVEISGCLASGLMTQVDNYFWLVVEKCAPYNATIYEFDKADISMCMDEYRYLINKIAEAEKKQEWPGYTDQADNKFGILQAHVPAYYNRI
ncbi:MAG TPA: PD-(D/E)XK nuclease-like domain-containing protein [Chryseolinea sp.]|nr:PD-(D/E)XK nuclease-like domain-containing protein [Chryseolinea sp.]